MSVVQIIVGLAQRGSGGGGGTPPSLTPIDSGVSLGLDWTVEFVADLFPTNFWATMWGNESWNNGQGHLAYLTSTVNLNVGMPNAMDEYVLAADVSVKSYWAFSHANGGGIDVYRNGQLLAKNFSGYSQPSSVASNTLLFGSRHDNSGSGQVDPISNGTYYWTNISSSALDATAIANNYASLQSTYGI
jgi:hypothetical protein